MYQQHKHQVLSLKLQTIMDQRLKRKRKAHSKHPDVSEWPEVVFIGKT
jgi:hypothetical protein